MLNGIDVSLILGAKLISLGQPGNLRIFGGYSWNNYTDISYAIDGNKFDAGNVNNNNHSVIYGVGVDLSHLAFDLKFINGFVDLTNSGVNDVESRIVNLTVVYKIR